MTGTDKLIVSINRPGRIRIVSDLVENIKIYGGTTAEHMLPKDESGTPKISYVRIEA